MGIIERIEELMERKGWTKYKLAKEAGLPQSTITSLLSGRVKSPAADTTNKLATALNVTTDYLLGNTDINLYDWVLSPEEEEEEKNKNSNPQESGKEFSKNDEIDIEKLVNSKLVFRGRALTPEEKEKYIKLVQALLE